MEHMRTIKILVTDDQGIVLDSAEIQIEDWVEKIDCVPLGGMVAGEDMTGCCGCDLYVGRVGAYK